MYCYLKSLKAYLTLDLLCAFGILGLIISISLPSLSSLIRSLNLKKESQKINYTLESLVTKATHNAASYTLTLEKNGLYVNSDAQQLLVKVRELPKRYSLNYQPLNQKIHFYKQGTCSPASFEINNGINKCIFTISLRCRTSVKCPN